MSSGAEQEIELVRLGGGAGNGDGGENGRGGWGHASNCKEEASENLKKDGGMIRPNKNLAKKWRHNKNLKKNGKKYDHCHE